MGGPCPDHGVRTVYDDDFDSLRCTSCGHRVRTRNREPVATRNLPFWRWFPELSGRRWARSTQPGSRPRISSQ